MLFEETKMLENILAFASAILQLRATRANEPKECFAQREDYFLWEPALPQRQG